MAAISALVPTLKQLTQPTKLITTGTSVISRYLQITRSSLMSSRDCRVLVLAAGCISPRFHVGAYVA